MKIMNSVDITYGGEIKGMINVIDKKTFQVNYTVEGDTKKTTTISILIKEDKKDFLMITFNYQDLKKLIEGDEDENNS